MMAGKVSTLSKIRETESYALLRETILNYLTGKTGNMKIGVQNCKLKNSRKIASLHVFSLSHIGQQIWTYQSKLKVSPPQCASRAATRQRSVLDTQVAGASCYLKLRDQSRNIHFWKAYEQSFQMRRGTGPALAPTHFIKFFSKIFGY